MMVGKMAVSLSGHDKGTIYVIVREEGEFLYLCDGTHKPLEHPKKKNRKHIQPVTHLSQEVERAMYLKDAFYNEGIKRAIHLFQRSSQDADKASKHEL
jgi:ribosomal protein L14E/L6E/L27E